MSSESLGIESSSEGPLMEVTLQSLSGLRCNLPSGGPSTKPPNVTAAVGFAGSASDMQVSSSFLCGKTGNVVVESQPAVFPSDVDTGETTCPLLVEWRESERSLSRSFSSTASSQAPTQPHLTIRLPERDQKVPCVPLSKINRDCNVVKDTNKDNPPSLDESETSSPSQCQKEQVDESEHSSEVRGASVVWSASGAAMPDIIELHVSLIMHAKEESCSRDDYRDEQQTTHQVGVAYLVFFGSDTEMTVLDLPMKKQTMSASHNLSGVSLDDNAFLRVRVHIMPESVSKVKAPLPIKESFFQDMQKVEPILQQLHMAHEDQQQQEESQQPNNEKTISGSRFLCGSGDVGIMDMLKTLSGVVKNCDDGEGVLHSTDSMGSTIVTSASLGI